MKTNKSKKNKAGLDEKYVQGYNEGAYEALYNQILRDEDGGFIEIKNSGDFKKIAAKKSDVIENVDQIKSWGRSFVNETYITYLFLAFIMGFSVCAIVVTPLVINSI